MSASINRAELADALALLTPVSAPNLDKKRLGNRSDGGYIVAGAFLDVHAAYSFGIGPDVSFDLDLAALGIPVRMFDHTVEGPGTTHTLFSFHKEGVGPADTPEQALFTLEHHLRRYGDWGRTDLFLKMDTEGAELAAFAQCGPGILRHFRQIVVELHWLQRLDESEYRAEFVRAMTALVDGFHIVHVHANNCVPVVVIEGLPVAAVLELTLVRKDLVSVSPNCIVYPTELDFANDQLALDYPLWYYPFLPAFGPEQASQSLTVMESNRERQASKKFPPSSSSRSSAAAAMSNEAIVRALYLLCLGREVDSSGLESYLGAISATGDMSVVLAGLLQSVEHSQAFTASKVTGVSVNGYRLESIRDQFVF